MGNNLVVVEQETLKDLISDAVFAATVRNCEMPMK